MGRQIAAVAEEDIMEVAQRSTVVVEEDLGMWEV